MINQLLHKGSAYNRYILIEMHRHKHMITTADQTGKAKMKPSPPLSSNNVAPPGTVASHSPCHHIRHLRLLLHICPRMIVATALFCGELPKQVRGELKITKIEPPSPTTPVASTALLQLPTLSQLCQPLPLFIPTTTSQYS